MKETLDLSSKKSFYQQFLEIKPEIKRVMDQTNKEITPAILKKDDDDQIISLLRNAKKSLEVNVTEDADILEHHIIPILKFFTYVNGILDLESLWEIMQKLFTLVGPSRAILSSSFLDSVLRNFKIVAQTRIKKKFLREEKEIKYYHKIAVQGIKRLHYLNKDNKGKSDIEVLMPQILPVMDFFVNALLIFEGKKKNFKRNGTLEQEIFKFLDHVCGKFDQHIFLSLLKFQYKRFAFTFNIERNEIKSQGFISIINEMLSMADENQFFLLNKLDILNLILFIFKEFLAAMSKFSPTSLLDIFLETLMKLSFKVLFIFDRIPNDSFIKSGIPKSNEYAGIVKNSLVSALFCFGQASEDHAAKYQKLIKEFFLKLNEIIQKNELLVLNEDECMEVLDLVCTYVKISSFGYSDSLREPLVKLGQSFAPMVVTPKIKMLRHYISGADVLNSNEKTMISDGKLESKENSEENFLALSPRIIKSFEDTEIVLNKIPLEVYSQFSIRADSSIEHILNILTVYQKKSLSEILQYSRYEKEILAIFYFKIVCGLDCLSGGQEFFYKEEILSLIEEIILLFEPIPKVQLFQLRVYTLQFINYLHQDKINFEKINKCSEKIIASSGIDYLKQKNSIFEAGESAVSHLGHLSIEDRSELRIIIYKLSNKLIDMEETQGSIDDMKNSALFFEDSLVKVISLMKPFLNSVNFENDFYNLTTKLFERLNFGVQRYKDYLLSGTGNSTILMVINQTIEPHNSLEAVHPYFLNLLLHIAKNLFSAELHGPQYSTLMSALNQSSSEEIEQKNNQQRSEIKIEVKEHLQVEKSSETSHSNDDEFRQINSKLKSLQLAKIHLEKTLNKKNIKIKNLESEIREVKLELNEIQKNADNDQENLANLRKKLSEVQTELISKSVSQQKDQHLLMSRNQKQKIKIMNLKKEIEAQKKQHAEEIKQKDSELIKKEKLVQQYQKTFFEQNKITEQTLRIKDVQLMQSEKVVSDTKADVVAALKKVESFHQKIAYLEMCIARCQLQPRPQPRPFMPILPATLPVSIMGWSPYLFGENICYVKNDLFLTPLARLTNSGY